MDVSNAAEYQPLLKKSQDALQAAALRKGQKPSLKLSREEIMFIIFRAPDNIAPESRVRICDISRKYPPSVAPLSTLAKTSIDDLVLETPHRGSYLLLRTITPPKQSVAIMSAVEDEFGGCECIQLYNIGRDPSRNCGKILPEGKVFIVKEPFYTENSASIPFICVDHDSDIIFLDLDDDRIPLEWRSPDGSFNTNPMDLKAEGDELFANDEYCEAIECYTRALKVDLDEVALVKALKLNRALAFLLVGLHDKALEDSEYVLKTFNSTDEKALFYAARALYMARKFEDCKAHLTVLFRNYPENTAAKDQLLKVFRRLQEERNGKYDFHEMRQLTSEKLEGPMKLDCADFVGPVSLQNTVNAGRGLFTTRDVKFGELLLCSKAFHVCHPRTDGESLIIDTTTNRMELSCGAELVAAIIQKISKNPSTSRELLELSSGAYERVQEEYVDGRPIVDTFLIHELRKINNFLCAFRSDASDCLASKDQDLEKQTGGAGIWIMASYINHACWGPGTVQRTFIGDMMIIRANADIKKGVEITFNYHDEDSDYTIRQQILTRSWGFTCNCRLCIAESQELRAMRTLRQAHLSEILALEPTQPGKLNIINVLPKMLRSLRSLEATYYNPPHNQPRYALGRALAFLTRMYVRLQRSNDVIDTGHRMLEALGYKIDRIPSQGKVVFREYGNMTNYDNWPVFFVQISSAYFATGRFAMARTYQRLAADFYEVTFGERVSFSEAYGRLFESIGFALEPGQ